MNYQSVYNQIIERAKKRNLEGYVERHHIVPRCLGGFDNLGNLVALTSREHFIAHALLCKIHPAHKGLRWAFHCLRYKASGNQQRYNSNLYMKKIHLKHTVESKAKMSRSQKGRSAWNKGISDERTKKISVALKGRKLSPEVRAIISKSVLGKKIHSEQFKAQQSARMKLNNPVKINGPWNKGIPRSEETKRKISNTLLNKRSQLC